MLSLNGGGGNIKANIASVHLATSLVLTAASLAYGAHCRFQGYTSNCTVLVNNVPIRTVAVVNHCHDPIDVTFLLRAREPPLDWRYTFVTSNVAETQTVPDFGDRWRMELHVALQKIRPNEIVVQADYHMRPLDRRGSARLFLNSTVTINSFADCERPPEAVISGPPSRITLTIAFVSFLATFVGGLVVWIFRRQGSAADESLLVDDTDVGLPGASPYQEGAAVEEQTGKVQHPFCVSFTAKKPAFDTVIENNFVQDDTETPHTPAEDT